MADATSSWQNDHATALRQAQRLATLIRQCDEHDRTSVRYSRCTAEAQGGMANFRSSVAKLKQAHLKQVSLSRLTQREMDRRQGMMEELQTKERQLQQMMQSSGEFPSSSQGNPWADENDHADMNVHDMRQHQANLIKEQDEGLDVLHQVIKKQKEIGLDITREIDRQDDILDDIQSDVDATDSRVRQETEHVRHIILKENRGNCAMWMMAILLLVAIVTIICLPSNL